jgi:hypothetical protein
VQRLIAQTKDEVRSASELYLQALQSRLGSLDKSISNLRVQTEKYPKLEAEQTRLSARWARCSERSTIFNRNSSSRASPNPSMRARTVHRRSDAADVRHLAEPKARNHLFRAHWTAARARARIRARPPG